MRLSISFNLPHGLSVTFSTRPILCRKGVLHSGISRLYFKSFAPRPKLFAHQLSSTTLLPSCFGKHILKVAYLISCHQLLLKILVDVDCGGQEFIACLSPSLWKQVTVFQSFSTIRVTAFANIEVISRNLGSSEIIWNHLKPFKIQEAGNFSEPPLRSWIMSQQKRQMGSLRTWHDQYLIHSDTMAPYFGEIIWETDKHRHGADGAQEITVPWDRASADRRACQLSCRSISVFRHEDSKGARGDARFKTSLPLKHLWFLFSHCFDWFRGVQRLLMLLWI